MAKIKHSFLKNSLLFCYKNVLNTDNETGGNYSKYDAYSLTDSDDEYTKINEIKRKLSKINSTANTILNRQLTTPTSSPETKTNVSKKKMQNVLIHYTGNPAAIPDLVVSSKQQTPSISSHSPKSPVSKHAKQNDENILPDILTYDKNEASLSRKKSLSLKEKKKTSSKLNRSKSSVSTKINVDNHSRARILSPISNVIPSNSSSSSSPSPLVTTPEMAKNKSAFPVPILCKQTSTSLMKQNSKEQINHRQSYPPDSFSQSQTNNFHNNNTYSTVGVRSQLQNINDHLARKTIEYITSSPPQRSQTSKPTTEQLKPFEFEISYNYYENSRSKNKNDQEINGVKLRNSRPLTSNEKPKRSLSAVSSTSTKKSVRFADSVGLELENIFNLSSLGIHDMDSKKISFLLSNQNYNKEDCVENLVYDSFPTVVKITPECNGTRKYVTRSNTISTPISINKNNILSVTVSPSISNDSIKSDFLQQNKLKTNQIDSKQNFVKTIRLANLTVRTRINKNGKLESEV